MKAAESQPCDEFQQGIWHGLSTSRGARETVSVLFKNSCGNETWNGWWSICGEVFALSREV
jgi:hypothetical protein